MRSGDSVTCENNGGVYLPDLEEGEGEIYIWEWVGVGSEERDDAETDGDCGVEE